MRIKVIYLGGTRGLTGSAEEIVQLPNPSLTGHQFMEYIFRRHPKLRDHAQSLRLAVDFEFVELDSMITEGAEVALVPRFKAAPRPSWSPINRSNP